MKHMRFSRVLSMLLALALVLSLLSGMTVFAATGTVSHNTASRHVVCTSLSTQAKAYYSGNNTYAKLSQLSGVSSPSDSWATTQNNDLYDALQSLMSSTHTVYTRYNPSGEQTDELSYLWDFTDSTAGSSEYLYFYTDVTADSYGTSTMQREHVWAKSRASFYQINGGADLHHLRPSIGGVNSSKSNYCFGNVPSGTAYQVDGQDVIWRGNEMIEVRDNVKGDVARILLYVYCRWGQPNLYTDVDSSKLPTMDSDDSANNGTRAIDGLETLLEWMEIDPVDQWEMARNDQTENYQGNRNVFIDYPEFAWLVLGQKVPTDYTTPSGEAANGGSTPTYTVTASSNNTSYGTVSVSGYTITATPKTGYEVSGYTILSGSATVSQNGNVFTVTPSSNCSIRINFQAKTYTVTATVNNSSYGSATVSGYTITATPKTGYEVSGYTILSGSATVSQNGNVFTVTPSSDCTIRINFQAKTYTVTATVNNSSYGSATVSGYTITATPKTGYEVSGYTLVSGTATVSQNGNVFTVTPSSNCTIRINFQARTSYTVSFSVPAGVSQSSLSAYAGESITLPTPTGTPTANAQSYSFLGWVTASVTDSTTKPTVYAAGSSYTPTANTTLYALYTYTADGDGSTSYCLVTDASVLKDGANVVIVAASANYAMSTTQNTNTRGRASVTKNTTNNTVSFTGSVCEFELTSGYYTDTWAFYDSVNEGYIYASSRMSNAMRTQSYVNANASFAITISGSNAVMTAQGSNTRNTIGYGSSSFACYSSTSTSRGAVQLYIKTTTGTTYYTTVLESICSHNYVVSSTIAATCTTAGSVTYTCSSCGDSYTETIAATGHSYTSKVTAPTCTAAGYTTYTCSNCGSSYTGNTVAATGHSYTSKVTAPTCTEAGYTTYTCSNCGSSYTGNTVAATGHSYTSKVTAPTCTAAGYTTYTCANCGSSYTGNTVAATGHSYSYTNNGSDHTVTCGNCDYNVTETHNYVGGTCGCGATESVAPAETTIKIGHTVSFDSDLRVNYRIKYTDLATAIPNYVTDGAYLVVEKDLYLATGETSVATVTLYPDLATDETRMVFSLGGIQSVEMGSELRAVLHVFDADGKEYYTPVDVYSVLTYAQSNLNATSNAAFRTLLIDLLNYGASAQVYFGRNTDNLVNAGMDAYQQYATTQLSEALTDSRTYVANSREITAVTAMGFSVTFADKTEMNAKLTLASGYTKDDITCVKVLDSSGNVVDTLTDFTVLSDGRLQVAYYGVKSIQMREMFYFAAYVGDQIASDYVGYSIEAYAKSNVSSSNTKLADMVLKCMYYGDAASAYFN